MTDRIPLAQHTKASLDALYERAERAEQEASDRAAADSADAAAGSYALRAERVEAQLDRVREVLPFAEQVIATTGIGPASAVQAVLDRLRAALAGPNNQRTTVDNTATSSNWTPPPPGDRREQLPDHILALLDIPPYTSTACETAELLAAAVARHPEHADELRQWEQRQRQRCRINNKYTGVICQHAEPDATDPDDLASAWTPDPPIGCLTITAEPTPSQRPDLHAQLAAAIRTAACDGSCDQTEDECARQRIQPIVWHHGRLAEVSGSPEQFADVVLTLLHQEWPWLRAEAEEREQQDAGLAAITAEAARRGVVSIDGIRNIVKGTRASGRPPVTS